MRNLARQPTIGHCNRQILHFKFSETSRNYDLLASGKLLASQLLVYDQNAAISLLGAVWFTLNY